MSIRDITIKDYDQLVPFWEENYFVNKMDSREKFKVFLTKNAGLSVLAEDNGNILGSALGSYDGRRGYIQKLVVSKSIRRNGLGKQLVKEVIKRLQSVGATYVPISVEKELIPFYEKCGFKKTDQVSMNIET